MQRRVGRSRAAAEGRKESVSRCCYLGPFRERVCPLQAAVHLLVLARASGSIHLCVHELVITPSRRWRGFVKDADADASSSDGGSSDAAEDARRRFPRSMPARQGSGADE